MIQLVTVCMMVGRMAVILMILTVCHWASCMSRQILVRLYY